MKIVDAFLANDEIEIIAFRLKALEEVVDKVYVAEAAYTFAGQPKPLYVKLFLDENPQLRKTVNVIEIPLNPEQIRSGDRWFIEEFSRDFLAQYVSERHAEDCIIFSDVDEVPDPEQVMELRGITAQEFAFDIPMSVSILFGNWELRRGRQYWRKAKAVKGLVDLSGLRYKTFPRIRKGGGVHFSYLGLSAKGIMKKYSSFSHQEYDKPAFSSADLIDFSVEYNVNHTGRAHDPDYGLISVRPESHMRPLQRSLGVFAPQLLSFEVSQRSFISRLCASWVVTKFIHSPFSKAVVDGFEQMVEKHLFWNLTEFATYRVVVGFGLGGFLSSTIRFLAGISKASGRRD